MNTAAAMDAQLEALVANGTDLPLLFCVPILVKDNYDALDGKAHNCQHIGLLPVEYQTSTVEA